MTLPRVHALRKYWQTFPPVHVSVAGFFGSGKPSEPPKPIDNAEIVRDMKADPRNVTWLPVREA